MADTKIDVNDVPDYVWDIGCSTLNDCLHRLFSIPGVMEDYEKWKKEESNVLQ